MAKKSTLTDTTTTELDERFEALLSLHELNLQRIDALRADVALLQQQMHDLLFWRPIGGIGRGPIMNVCEVTDAGPEGTQKRMVYTYLSGATSEYEKGDPR